MIKKFLKSQKLVIFIIGTHGSTAHYMYSTSRFFFVFVSFRFVFFFCSKFYKIVINYHLVSMRVFRQVPQTFELCYTNQVIIKIPQLFVFLSEKPVIKIKSPQPSSVIEGSTLYLDCVATGFPRPRVTWVRIRDGQVLQNRTNDEATSYYSYYSVESLCRISLALLQFFF